MSDIGIVCFDVGGVVVRICHDWPAACRAAGVELRGDWAHEVEALARRELTDLFVTGRLTEAEWAERLSPVLRGRYSADELKRIHHAILLDEYPGVGQLVDELHAAGVPTACLSNTNHSHWVRLVHRDGAQALPGAPRYPAVAALGRHFASHLFGLAKPDPAMYRAFERETGFGGDQILFFDDLPENLAAASALGWRAERVDPESDTAPQIRRALGRHRLL
jgi:putative hydrolase of the HAD superfamily